MLKESIGNNIMLVFLLWLMGSTVIGLLLVYLIVCFKGFCFGYTVSSIIYVLGTGKYIINQYPLKNTSVSEYGKVFLVSNNTDYIMEDITGWSLNEVMTYTSLLGIELVTNGYGYVTSQSIPAGTPITSGISLNVTLSK